MTRIVCIVGGREQGTSATAAHPSTKVKYVIESHEKYFIIGIVKNENRKCLNIVVWKRLNIEIKNTFPILK